MTDSFTISPVSREFEPSPRWVRVYFSGELIADSKAMMLLREPGQLPLYYFPKKDVRLNYLQPSGHMVHSGRKGEGVFWNVQVRHRTAENAAFTFRKPLGNGPKLENYVAFEWNRMDAWFEEDEEVFGYARDPYRRVDILQSSRHIEVRLDGIEIANTKRPWLLFETGLPTRYYVPKHDVSLDLLEPSSTVSRCPYKGKAHYYSVKIGDNLHKDLIWSYRYPVLESAKIQGFLGFLNERLDIYEDCKLLPRPKSPWS